MPVWASKWGQRRSPFGPIFDVAYWHRLGLKAIFEAVLQIVVDAEAKRQDR